jgi:AraC-like DNA-binding protein
MLVSTAPGAVLWPAAMLVWGPGYRSSKHQHHCVQLVMALKGELLVRSGPGRKWTKCRAILVKPDAPHEVEAVDVRVLLAFVESESSLGAALLAMLRSDFSIVPDSTVAQWRRYLGDPKRLDAHRVEVWVRQHLLSGRRMPHLHPGVRKVLQMVREEIGTGDDFSLSQMAKVAGLSPSRFMHVFTEAVGVPLRPYILWLRLQLACGELMRGASIIAAAQLSGFADAAHLTRTVRRMLGMTPGEIVQRRAQVRAAFATPH